MIISGFFKYALISTIFVIIALTVSADSYQCQDVGDISEQCKTSNVKEPTWWGWLTDTNTTQFHFFDLIELMYDDDSSYREFTDHAPNQSLR